MSRKGLTALALEYCGASYSVPYYTLPWNLFFGTVKPYPFYLANTLTNIAVREAQSPLTYDAHVQIRKLPDEFDNLTPAGIYDLRTIGRLEFYNPSQKVLLGRSRDYDGLTTDLNYQYNVTARFVRVHSSCDDTSSSDSHTYVFAVDLNVTPGFYNVDVADLPHGDYDDRHEHHHRHHAKAAGGSINLDIIDNIQPLIDGEDSKVKYLITGNRIWFFYKKEEDFLSDLVQVSFNFQIIERPLPVTICDLASSLLIPKRVRY